MNILNVTSEIGILKTVILHEPGKELENLTPNYLEELLFDDIPWLPLAIKEHQAFAKVLRDNGVEVVYLIDLVAESLNESDDIKNEFIVQFISEANINSETLSQVLIEYLKSFSSTKKMVAKTMAGIKRNEIPHYIKKNLTDFIRDYPFVANPMPNLYFTRDPFTIINNSASLSKMFSRTRSRETIYGEYIFKYHPKYKLPEKELLYKRNYDTSIEGGDILVLSDKIIAIGISQRTHPTAIERLAKNIFYNNDNNFSTILAFDLPKDRSFMHLDTVLTQVDYDKFTIHSQFQKVTKIYEITPNPKKKSQLLVKPLDASMEEILSKYLEVPIMLIPCGGNDSISSDREQWNDGANTLAIAPGEVIVYERNHITNDILKKSGIKIHPIPSSELSRGRGGPRCMAMPLFRYNLEQKS
ncbi:MAG TPA: arginine deiminase [Bacilli bacterium]|nr:arginine deiminase [Bacilli bacterium]